MSPKSFRISARAAGRQPARLIDKYNQRHHHQMMMIWFASSSRAIYKEKILVNLILPL